MKLRNDFYFQFSIGLLFFMFIGVFYLYETKYNFSNFLDTKTILQVFGTLGGAYYGAKIAGKYSVNVMLDQYRMQKIDELQKVKIRENRKNLYIHLSVITCLKNVDFLVNLSRGQHESHGYLNSMESIIQDMSKVVLIFDNIDYLELEEELIPKYMKLQIYIKGIVSISKDLRSIHQVIEEKIRPEGKVTDSEINHYTELGVSELIGTQTLLQEAVNDIKWNVPTSELGDF